MSQRKYIKNWSYRQVTAATENSLRIEMELAGAERDGKLRYIHECRASGVLAAWNMLTMGWQQAGDARRLEAMARTPLPIPVEFSADCHVCLQVLDTRTAVPLEQRGQGRLYRHVGCQLK